MVRWHLNGRALTFPAPDGRFINTVALGNKEVLWNSRRRVKPGGLRRGVHPGLPSAPPRGRHGSHSLRFRPCECYASVAGVSRSPAKHAVVLCVCSERASLQKRCTGSRPWQQRRAVPISAHNTPMGTSLWAQYLPGRYHHSRAANAGHLGPQPTARYQGGLQGEIHPKPFLLNLADSRGAAYITPGPRGKCQNRIELGGSMLLTVLPAVTSRGWNKGGGNWNMRESGHTEKDQGHLGWRDWHCNGKETGN